jgi:predicted nucleotide-binding protein
MNDDVELSAGEERQQKRPTTQGHPVRDATTELSSRELLALVESAKELSSEIDLDEVLAKILNRACQLTESESASIFLHDGKGLFVAAAVGPQAAAFLATFGGTGPRIPSETKAGRVFATGEALAESRIAEDPEHFTEVDPKLGHRTESILCVPLETGSDRIGVIQLINKSKVGYTPTDVVLLQHLASHAAVVIRNARRIKESLALRGFLPDSMSQKVSPPAQPNPETPETEEWVSAAAALTLLGIQGSVGTRTICKRAHAGLIKARAERFIRDGRLDDDYDIPLEFWWAEGEPALYQNWESGDFDTWIDNTVHLQAFGVVFRRSDIERLRPRPALSDAKIQRERTTEKVFIGHGRSPIWRVLKDFLVDRLHLPVEEFNNVPTAGMSTVMRLTDMLDGACFAFLVMTAEDEQPDGELRARENVVHEAGRFQGRLGFQKAIILLQQGCGEFSNIHGLGQIRFPEDQIEAIFEEIRRVLEREGVLSSSLAG